MMKKEKYLQIFNYLLEFSKLRSKPARDIESAETQYPEIIWFADIPHHEIFECITNPNFNQENDYWIKINKPKEPLPPNFTKLSDNLETWLTKETLTDENNVPSLKNSIVKNGKEIFLQDNPQIEQEFQKYLNEKWLDDLVLYKNEYNIYENKLLEYEKLSHTYRHFFSICNKSQQFGEEYELIVGVGLLHFKENDNTPFICRHILTSKAEITLPDSSQKDSKVSFVKVSPSIENDIQIETDAIIDLFEQFDSSLIIKAEDEMKKYLRDKDISDNPFDIRIKDAIQIFADKFHVDGQFKDDLSKSKEIATKPTIYFAPALILRKRNTKSFTALYEKIIKDISDANDSLDIPPINDIIGYLQQSEDLSDGSTDENLTSLNDETIYFPKKYNDEQIEIIQKAKRNSKVLVQGPPGTGKSHTIANLICHLLANGKKVLVTAYTKRALEVLKNQLSEDSEDFKNLTVNLLSSDSTSIQDLQASVNAINDELSRANLTTYKKQIEELEAKLSQIKENKALTKNELISLKEKTTRKQLLNQLYSGTLTDIAERLEKEAPSFNWFKDEFTDISMLTLVEEIEKFILLTKKYHSIDCSIYTCNIPQKEHILSMDELKKCKNISDLLNQKHKDTYKTIECRDIQELKKVLEVFYKVCLQIENNNLPFKSELLKEYNIKQNAKWNHKLSHTLELLNSLAEGKLKDFDRDIEIEYRNNKSLKQLKNDGQTLLDYLKAGNSLSGLLFNLFKKPFLPQNIKEKIYFIETVKVNGSPCDTVSEFELVLSDIQIKQCFEELSEIWRIPFTGNSNSYFEKFKFYKYLNQNTEALINSIIEADDIKQKIEATSSIKLKSYEPEFIKQIGDEVYYNILLKLDKGYKERIDETKRYLSRENIHPIAARVIMSIEEIDPHKYEGLLAEIDKIFKEQKEYTDYKHLQDVLQQHLPILANEILSGSFDSNNLQLLEKAIYYKHAKAEIERLLNEDYERQLLDKLTDIEQQEEKKIAILGSKRAWVQVLERLQSNPQLQQHLIAWKQAVKSIPKTRTSPNYHHFKKIAQREMEYCKQSIPCWIMPLYQVVENFLPEPEIFDYVIVDEASQLGPDAVFLFYISKNVIVVGDDKQTAPEYVGVDEGTVKAMIQKHLKPNTNQGIPFADFYGTKHSFFDHCDRICAGKRIVLREHFRCMPEIIEFSNKHFYAPEGKGLYPLKQYSENRLEPLKTVYCQNGYTEGHASNIVNKVEAENIANKIDELVKDERYKGKTFGVIGLQGNNQGALIENLVLKKIGEAEYRKRKIVCGTSASFQGDERDVMFLSLITAHNHRRQALTDDNDKRRFNVAVSRAKEQVWLFHSVQLEDLSNTNDLRYKLLDHFLNYKESLIIRYDKIERKDGKQPPPFESWPEVDVYNDIVSKGYGVIPQYKIAKGKYRIDLVPILPNGTKIAVEYDGKKDHGPEQFLNDLMRQKVLERCGWQFFRVRGAEYYSNRKKALEPLWKLLRTNDSQKEEPSITNKYQQNGVEEIKNGTVEIIQPVAKKTFIPQINKKVKQPQQMAIQEIVKDKKYSSEDSSVSITPISIEDKIIEILSEEGPMPIWKIAQTLEQPLEKTIQEMEKLLEQGWVIKYYEGGVKVWKAIN